MKTTIQRDQSISKIDEIAGQFLKFKYLKKKAAHICCAREQGFPLAIDDSNIHISHWCHHAEQIFRLLLKISVVAPDYDIYNNL